MSIPVPDLFASGIDDVPTAQEQQSRAVEQATVAAAMPFEAEKQLVNRDHVSMQRHIWGLEDDHMRPVEVGDDGRNG